MAMENKFTKLMSKKTSHALIKILTIDRENYQPEAIEAAEIVVKSRNLSEKQIERANKINEKKVVIAQEKAEKPLCWVYKIWLILIPIRVFAMSASYENEGYERKAREAVNWSYVGFIMYALLLIFN
jgi:hypothetical protein